LAALIRLRPVSDLIFARVRCEVTGELDTAGMARLAASTSPGNLMGTPRRTVPCAWGGLPVGLQILGRAGSDSQVLAAARRVEAVFGAHAPPRGIVHG
jgi:Asp-tRNA(Asn)/Glu-tRNA(Gln) amidotransferase A subunit family amidase